MGKAEDSTASVDFGLIAFDIKCGAMEITMLR
jgi:hypothetical protein